MALKKEWNRSRKNLRLQKKNIILRMKSTLTTLKQVQLKNSYVYSIVGKIYFLLLVEYVFNYPFEQRTRCYGGIFSMPYGKRRAIQLLMKTCHCTYIPFRLRPWNMTQTNQNKIQCLSSKLKGRNNIDGCWIYNGFQFTQNCFCGSEK